MSTFSKPSEPMLGVLWFEGTQKYKTRAIELSRSAHTHASRTSSRAPRTRSAYHEDVIRTRVGCIQQ